MTSVYARNFDQELEQESAALDRAARAGITPEELAAALSTARAEAWEAGHAAGCNAGRAEISETLFSREVAALEALAPQLDTVFSAAATHRAALEAQTLEFALSVCERTFPELIRQRALERAAVQIRRTVDLALGSPVLRVFLSPSAEPRLRAVLTDAAARQGYAGRVEITADAGLAPGDVRAGWDNGFLEYSFAAVCDRILDALRRSRSSLDIPPTSIDGSDAHA